MMMRAQGLLEKNAAPSDAQIREAMAPNLCRCGTQMRILRAVHRAAKLMTVELQQPEREAER
jgi:nicotinate dehydrogenase subunit A